MSALLAPPAPIPASPRTKVWTKAEFYRLGELGFFQGQRVELIGGELMVFSPQLAPHAQAVEMADNVLRAIFGAGYRVRCQLPLDLGLATEPDPDLAVVSGALPATPAHPTTAVLVIEVSDTTLAYDRGRKASLYARALIADYWIVNPEDGQIEIHRDPVADASQPFGFRFSTVTIIPRTGPLTPLALPGASIPAASLLP